MEVRKYVDLMEEIRLENGKTMMPSAKKMGVAGTELNVPVQCKEAALVRSHFDAMAVRVRMPLGVTKSLWSWS